MLDLGEDLRQVEALHTAGRAQLVEEQHGKHKIVKDIRLDGSLETRVELACARCLEPVLQDVEHNFDLLYRPQGPMRDEKSFRSPPPRPRSAIIRARDCCWKMYCRSRSCWRFRLKAICRDDCKGLCPHCGKNLNVEQCACAEPLEDPRWSALKDIRGKLDH